MIVQLYTTGKTFRCGDMLQIDGCTVVVTFTFTRSHYVSLDLL